MLHSYDTNFFIRKILVNPHYYKKILEDFKNEDCIILRSILDELIKHFWIINSELDRLAYELKKTSSKNFFSSNNKKYLDFKKHYKEIAECIENEYKKGDIYIIDKISKRVSGLDINLREFAFLFPQTEEQYSDIKKNDKYKELSERMKNNKDSLHFALLEIYGEQIKRKIKFYSCDRNHITGFFIGYEIKRKYPFIEPIHCDEWN